MIPPPLRVDVLPLTLRERVTALEAELARINTVRPSSSKLGCTCYDESPCAVCVYWMHLAHFAKDWQVALQGAQP